MLLTRAEMSHDWKGARFDLARDRQMLGWMFNQFLYGEVTGIQCGHWIYNAPDLESARFLAKQAIEEFQHIDNFLRCMAIIGVEPERPNRIIRFLTSGMMPEDWAEHVSLEMAFGEGLVLACFYALIDTLPNEEITGILSRATKQEESHVDFGEQQTMALIAKNPGLERRLLGLNLMSLFMVKRLARHIERTMDMTHPVLSQLGDFLAMVVRASETRLERLGLTDRPLAEMSGAARFALIAEAYAAGAIGSVLRLPLRLIPFAGRPRRLTDTYLSDPAITQFLARARDKARRDQPAVAEPLLVGKKAL